jgi:hypothetical protein
MKIKSGEVSKNLDNKTFTDFINFTTQIEQTINKFVSCQTWQNVLFISLQIQAMSVVLPKLFT